MATTMCFASARYVISAQVASCRDEWYSVAMLLLWKLWREQFLFMNTFSLMKRREELAARQIGVEGRDRVLRQRSVSDLMSLLPTVYVGLQ